MTNKVHYLDLADFLLVGEAVLQVRAEVLVLQCDLHLADSALNAPQARFGGVEFYPDFANKAAILCWHLARNHPLPDGNKRTAYLCLTEFVERNGYIWVPPIGDPGGDQTVEMMVEIADNKVSVEKLTDWVLERLSVTPG